MSRSLVRMALAGVAALSLSAHARKLQGFVDMHTHPMSHLGFGGVVMYGAPDESAMMLKWVPTPLWCFNTYEAAGPISESLGNCNAIHGAPGFPDNVCGDLIRNAITDKIEKRYQFEVPNWGLLGQVADHPHLGGYPSFAWWPHWSSVTHQQMRWEWIRRAFDGGQRVMVALAVNNALLAKAGNAPAGIIDDRSSVLNQLHEIEAFVGRHSDFMAIARTATELRSIVSGGRLAIVMGVETDDFGNLTRRARFGGEAVTTATVNAELDTLFAAGVRYLLPVHFSDSVLGGYAINDDLFVLNSKEYANGYPRVVESCGQGVLFNVDRTPFTDPEATLLRTRDLGRVIDAQPVWAGADAGCGHQNALGLTTLGASAIGRMMDLGMIIDIDHMSRRMADGVIALARTRNYPLNSGHNGPLAGECSTASAGHPDGCNENARTPEQYRTIRSLGGMAGLGHGGGATNFVRAYRQVHELMGNLPLGIGTDVNGLEPMPGPDTAAPVTYSTGFPRYNFPSGRAWDLNVDGFAHYGLFPDYIRAWQSSPTVASRITTQELESFMTSAEQFARMWARSEQRSAGAPYSGSLSRPTVWCTHAGARIIPGDFNGDGATDLACRDARFLWIDYADRFGALSGTNDTPPIETSFCAAAGERLLTGDFDGDGRTDLLCHNTTGYRIALATLGGVFGGISSSTPAERCTHAGATLRTADVNGDGRTDLLCTDPANVWVEWADARGEFQGVWDDNVTSTVLCPAGGVFHLADVNGDGRSDVICREGSTLRVRLALPSGRISTSVRTTSTVYCTHAGAEGSFKDVNGDGRADWVCRGTSGWMWADYADEYGRYLGEDWGRDTGICEMAGGQFFWLDINGDRRDDAVCKSPTAVQVRYASQTGAF